MNRIRKRKVNTPEKPHNFIMLPTVDFCFKELMQNPKVRQGIISAILNVSPDRIQYTKLMPTILQKEHQDDKFGILDVRVMLKDRTQIDLEMHILELSKLPPEDRDENGIILWMRFLGGKCEEDFKKWLKRMYILVKHMNY